MGRRAFWKGNDLIEYQGLISNIKQYRENDFYHTSILTVFRNILIQYAKYCSTRVFGSNRVVGSSIKNNLLYLEL